MPFRFLAESYENVDATLMLFGKYIDESVILLFLDNK